LEWDKDGEYIAAISKSCTFVILWEVSSNKEIKIECNTQPTCIKWGVCCPFLAVGTDKGNLVLYNKKTGRRNILMGVCTRKINCGSWNENNCVALGGDDGKIVMLTTDGVIKKTFTVSAPVVYLEHGDIMTGAYSKPGETKGSSLLAVDSNEGIKLYSDCVDEYSIELSQNFGKIKNIQFLYFYFLFVYL
jgi:WD40 repeat protein